MSNAVFLGRDGRRLGPYTQAELAALAARGAVRATDLAWHEALDAWEPAMKVLGSLGIVSMPQAPSVLPQGQLGAAAVSEIPKEQPNQLAMYEAFIGPDRAAYYLPLFERFDAGGKTLSWNWPAALITQWWLLYRGMYLWCFLLYPVLYSLAIFAVIAAMVATAGVADSTIGYLITLPGSFVLMGLYGNKIFHRHVRSVIERSGRLGLSDQARREWLIRKGAGNSIFVLVMLLLGAAVIGILVMIAIPAFQDYTIRSQVYEGAVLSEPLKPAIAKYYADRRDFPADNESAGLPKPAALHGKYVQQMEVVNGIILATYGGDAANRRITWGVLAYVPETSGDAAAIAWQCNTPATTLPNKYLPQACWK